MDASAGEATPQTTLATAGCTSGDCGCWLTGVAAVAAAAVVTVTVHACMRARVIQNPMCFHVSMVPARRIACPGAQRRGGTITRQLRCQIPMQIPDRGVCPDSVDAGFRKMLYMYSCSVVHVTHVFIYRHKKTN